MLEKAIINPKISIGVKNKQVALPISVAEKGGALYDGEYTIGVENKQVALSISVAEKGGALYDGEYTITPKTEAQMLETAGKRMLDNLNINSIPFYEVSNSFGGHTIYIGSDLNA